MSCADLHSDRNEFFVTFVLVGLWERVKLYTTFTNANGRLLHVW